MNTRYNMPMYDGRNPYGSRGGYVNSRRSRRGRGRRDRAMRGGDYAENQMANYDMRSDYRSNSMGGMDYNYDMQRNDYGYDGHYGNKQSGKTYYPIEAMGTFNGYYGMSEEDFARGGRGSQDYGYDMRYDMRGSYGRGGRDYGYDYGYDYGDYGETLTEEELEKWCKKLKGELDEREKQMFSKEVISQKAKSMGKSMEGFGEKELEVTTLMVYTDYKNTIGSNPDLAIKMAFDWLNDKDVAVKGAEKLAVYYDCIVEGESD